MQLAAPARHPPAKRRGCAALAGWTACARHVPGRDAGIEGLHPQQAVLVDDPRWCSCDPAPPACRFRPTHRWATGPAGPPGYDAAGPQRTRSRRATAGEPARADAGPWSQRARRACCRRAALPGAHRLPRRTGGAIETLGVLYLAQASGARRAGPWEQGHSQRGQRCRHRRAPLPADTTVRPGHSRRTTSPRAAMQTWWRAPCSTCARQPLVSLTLSQSFRRPFTGIRCRRLWAAAPGEPGTGCFLGQRRRGWPPVWRLARPAAGGAGPHGAGAAGVRHRGPQAPARWARPSRFASWSTKHVDAASLAVCSDALRDDLAPLCEPGSLRLLDRRRPMSLATVVHTVDRLQGACAMASTPGTPSPPPLRR
jgi:hypothetical protein